MKISAKGRYALAAAIDMARQYNTDDHIAVISIAERLGVSKIYLEQVFSLLKRSGLVRSVKGAQGGYQLLRTPAQITALDILSAVETALFEKTAETVPDKAEYMEQAMHTLVFAPLDDALTAALRAVTLEDLVNEAEKHQHDQPLMFYI